MAKVLIVHGPNLNLLGKREPEIYGKVTLDELNKQLIQKASSLGFELECFQSNHEGELIEKIQSSSNIIDFLIMNPAAYTHSSIALRDSVLASEIPLIEIHLSNIYARESYRKHSFFSDIALGLITGLGHQGYFFALEFAHHQLNQK